MVEDIEVLKEAEKESSEQKEFAETDTHTIYQHNNSNWLPGVMLIAIGTIFLFTELTHFSLNNWWALFILIPAFSNFGQAWRRYQQDGRLSHAARGSLTGGLIIALIAFAFLFNLNWGLIWPIFLIIGGLSALLGGWFD